MYVAIAYVFTVIQCSVHENKDERSLVNNYSINKTTKITFPFRSQYKQTIIFYSNYMYWQPKTKNIVKCVCTFKTFNIIYHLL